MSDYAPDSHLAIPEVVAGIREARQELDDLIAWVLAGGIDWEAVERDDNWDD